MDQRGRGGAVGGAARCVAHAGAAVAFVTTHHGIAADAAALAAAAVVSQVAINVAIKSYGAVVYTAVMTLRHLNVYSI